MSEIRVLLDPTHEQSPSRRQQAPRPASLEGLTIGLLDIAKARGDVFLARLEVLLSGRGAQVRRIHLGRAPASDASVQILHQQPLLWQAEPALLQQAHQVGRIGGMQAGGRLVQQVQRAPGRAARQLFGQLHALRLAA